MNACACASPSAYSRNSHLFSFTIVNSGILKKEKEREQVKYTQQYRAQPYGIWNKRKIKRNEMEMK